MSEDSQLVPADDRQLAIGGSGGPEKLLALALEKGAGVDVMERLLAMHERMKATSAKEAFDKALSDFQAECPIIVKTKFGAKDAYKYAPLDRIVVQTKALIQKHGFSFSVTGAFKPGWVMAKVKITHTAGHSEVSEFEAPIDSKNPMMSEPQRYGGAMTFAKRQAFTNGFGILTADEDIDGGTKPPPKFGPQGRTPQDDPPQDSTPPRTVTPPPASQPAPAAASGPNEDPEAKKSRAAIWAATKGKFKTGAELQQYLWDEGVLLDHEELQKIPLARLKQVLNGVEFRIP